MLQSTDSYLTSQPGIEAPLSSDYTIIFNIIHITAVSSPHFQYPTTQTSINGMFYYINTITLCNIDSSAGTLDKLLHLINKKRKYLSTKLNVTFYQSSKNTSKCTANTNNVSGTIPNHQLTPASAYKHKVPHTSSHSYRLCTKIFSFK